jgi:hypothetical protein
MNRNRKLAKMMIEQREKARKEVMEKAAKEKRENASE